MRKHLIQHVAVWLAVVGFCVPQAALAAGTQAAPAIFDVALHQGGTLVGQVVDVQGLPQQNVPVSLRGAAGELASAETNEQGYFAFGGLKSGVYEVATTGGGGLYRAWSHTAAPPAARPGALIVSDGTTVRGTVLGFFGERPLLTAGLIAAAIAIPIAVTADNGSGPSSP